MGEWEVNSRSAHGASTKDQGLGGSGRWKGV